MKKIFYSVVLLFYITGFCFAQENAVTPASALYEYIHNCDETRAWEIREEYEINETKTYSLLLISQKWKGILWKHELIIHVPKEIKQNGVLLFVEGGRVENGIPAFTGKDSKTSQMMSIIAEENKAVVGILRQVPNQPLYGGLNEDALISYTLGEFRKDGDYSWPLLFPMVKSVHRGMDCIREFAKEYLNQDISGFVISGFSKRGWTTWLTGASQDPRVLAIAPMVIDMLNMPVSLDYQRKLYGEYSEEIGDYVKMDIPQAMHSDFGKAVVRMIDPYSYRRNLTLPKMIFMGTNDPYWTVDAVKHYLDSIPGVNFLHYVANAGHGLGDKRQALEALSAFFSITVNETAYPEYSWDIIAKKKQALLRVRFLPDSLVKAKLWTAYSSTRDFRQSEWKEVALQPETSKGTFEVEINYPKTGFVAFYVDLIYKNASGGEYSISTRVYVTDNKQIFID